MILKTNVNEAVPILRKGVTSFMFEEGNHASDFIKSIGLCLKRKKELNEDAFYLMDEAYQDINYKEIYPILMDCGKLELDNEKSFKDNTVGMFEKMIFEHPEINERFHQLQVSIDELVNRLEIVKPHYTIEFQSETFDVKKLLKLLQYDIHRNGTELNHIYLRECYFDIMKKMNVDNKEIILFVVYPENHLGVQEVDRFMKWLHQLNVTIIVLTNDFRIIKNTKLNYVNLIKHNKQNYDIIDLSNELRLFSKVEESLVERLSVQLSYFDFTGSDLLIHESYREFLASSKT